MTTNPAREKIARLLCEQHGGNPDAVASEPHDCWEGPLWTEFLRDADAILSLLPTPDGWREGDRIAGITEYARLYGINPDAEKIVGTDHFETWFGKWATRPQPLSPKEASDAAPERKHSFGHCKDCPGVQSLMCCKSGEGRSEYKPGDPLYFDAGTVSASEPAEAHETAFAISRRKHEAPTAAAEGGVSLREALERVKALVHIVDVTGSGRLDKRDADDLRTLLLALSAIDQAGRGKDA